jgi:hypothetical protein
VNTSTIMTLRGKASSARQAGDGLSSPDRYTHWRE